MRGERAGYEYLVITYNPPGKKALPMGLLLWDKAERRLHYSLGKNWLRFIAEDDREMATEISDDLIQKIEESNGEEFLLYCEDTLSNVLRVTERIPVESEAPAETILSQLEKQIIQERNKVLS